MIIRTRFLPSNFILIRKILKDLVLSRIGADVFHSRIERLKDSKIFTQTEKNTYEEHELIFDFSYLEFIRIHLDFITKMVTAPTNKKPPTQKEKEKEVEPTILKELDQKIQTLQKENQSKTKEIETLRNMLGQMEQSLKLVPLMEKSLLDKEEKLKEIEHDQEDLFLCLADQEIEIKELKKRLMGFGEVFSESDED
jgi:hypothetical protein